MPVWAVFKPNFAAEIFAEFLRNAQADATSVSVKMLTIFQLLEGLEQIVALLFRNAYSCVGHLDLDQTFYRVEVHYDRNLTISSEFNGVVQQIEEDLLKADRVTLDLRGKVLGHNFFDVDLVQFGLAHQNFVDFLDHFLNGHLLFVGLEFACFKEG